MARILIFGETRQEYKERLIELSLNGENANFVVGNGIRSWASTKMDIKFYEITDRLASVDSFPLISEISICWIMLSKTNQINEASSKIFHQLKAKEKNVVFIVTNQGIAELVKNKYGTENKILGIKYEEINIISDSNLKESVKELQLVSNMNRISNNQVVPTEANCPQFNMINANIGFNAILEEINANKTNMIELFIIGFEEFYAVKSAFVKSLVGNIKPISTQENMVNIYSIVDRKIILYDLLEILDAYEYTYSGYIPRCGLERTNTSIIKDFLNLRSRSSIPIITFFSDNEGSLNFITANCKFNLPRIIVSTDNYVPLYLSNSNNILNIVDDNIMENNLNTSIINLPMLTYLNKQLNFDLQRYIGIIPDIISNLSTYTKFSILVTGKREERASIINAIMYNTVTSETENDDVFRFFTCVDSPVTLIEYCDDLSSRKNDIQSFHEQFSDISYQYNCLCCWSVTKSSPSNYHKEIMKELKEIYNISSILIKTNEYYFFNLREEKNRKPSKYNADSIIVMPMSSDSDPESNLIDLMISTKDMIHHPYKFSMEKLIKIRDKGIKESNVSEYAEFELNKAQNMSKEFRVVICPNFYWTCPKLGCH